MNKSVYILGGAQTDFQRNWTKEGKSFIGMMREVIYDALNSVNIDINEIKSLNKNNRIGIFVGNFDGEQYFNQGHLGAFLTEINPAFYGVPGARYEAACASGSVAIDAASAKIRSDDYDVAIVLGIEMMKTVDSLVCGDYLGTAAYYQKEAKNISFPFPKLFGQLADVYLEKYPIPEKKYLDCLAFIANLNYRNAKNNPKAQTRTWFMNQSHAATRGTKYNSLVGGKLGISDCSQITDGAVAIVLVSKKYLLDKKISDKNISEISGWGHRVAPVQFSDKIKESHGQPYVLPWTRITVLDALNRACLNEKDVDFYETHDCFTSSEYMAISAFGITGPGEEYQAVESGLISFDGSKPVNSSGGLIGCGHPVGATGVRMMLDLHKQVTKNAGDYQIKKSDIGLMLNIGGSATTNYVFIVKKA